MIVTKKGFLSKMTSEIWILSIVSMFMNISTIVVTSFTPYFVISILGGSPMDVGYIRGISESLSYVVKLFSGILSDMIGKRKILVVIGYGLSALTKPMFAWCNTKNSYFLIQTLERFANGLRDTPRDALMADYSPKEIRASCFAMRQGFSYFGSAIGALLCYILTTNMIDVRTIYAFASLPVVVATALLFYKIKDLPTTEKTVFKINHLKSFDKEYYIFLIVVFFFMTMRFNEGFLIMRAESLGLNIKYHSLLLLVLYFFNAITTKTVAIMSNKTNKKTLLIFGTIIIGISFYMLKISQSATHVFFSVVVYGVHYGFTQSTFYSIIADYSPKDIKGTAFGIFNLVCAMGLLVANTGAGYIWQPYDQQRMLSVCCIISIFVIILLSFIKIKEHR